MKDFDVVIIGRGVIGNLTALAASKANFGWMGKNYPGRRQVMFKALMNTRPSHLLDPQLFDFEGLTLKK